MIEKLSELRDGKAVAAGADRSGEKSAPRTGVNDPGYKSDTPRVAEKAATVDSEKIWERVVAKIPTKGFLRTLSESVRPIGIDGRNFLLGHSPEDKSKIEALASANNRRQLETLLREVSERDWSVKFVAKEGIPPARLVAGDATAATSGFTSWKCAGPPTSTAHFQRSAESVSVLSLCCQMPCSGISRDVF